METMTIHQNRPKEQYRHASLNGLIIGAVPGVAWAVEFLLPFLFPLGNYSRNVRMALISLVLPVIGWITGVRGRTVRNCTTPAKKKGRVKIIGVVMAAIIGILLATTYYIFVAGIGTFYVPDNSTFSRKAFVMYLAPLSVFLVAGWGLGIARINTPNDRHSIVSKMSAWVALGLYLSVAAWFAISLLLDFLFFFEILKYFSIVCEIWER